SGLFLLLGFVVGVLAEHRRLRHGPAAILLVRRLAMHTHPREWHCFEPLLANRLLAQLAQTVVAEFETLERFLDLVERVLFARHEAQRKLAVKIIRTGIGHVEAIAAELTAC